MEMMPKDKLTMDERFHLIQLMLSSFDESDLAYSGNVIEAFTRIADLAEGFFND